MRYDVAIEEVSCKRTGRYRVGLSDAHRWLEYWGYWLRAQAEQVGIGSGAVSSVEDPQCAGQRSDRASHSDPVLAELLAVERDPEHEISRRIDLSVRAMDKQRRAVCVCRYRGVGRRTHGVVRWEYPDWPEVGRRCGGISAHAARETARGAKQIVLVDMAEAIHALQGPKITVEVSD